MRWSEVRIALLLALIAAVVGLTAGLEWRAMSVPQREYAQTAFSVFGALMTLFIAFFALVAAQRSAEASEAQVIAANCQVVVADAQAEAAKKQTQLLEQQLKADARPTLVLKLKDKNLPIIHAQQVLRLKNKGPGTVSRIRFWWVNMSENGRRDIADGLAGPNTIPPAATYRLGIAPEGSNAVEVCYYGGDETPYTSHFLFIGTDVFETVHTDNIPMRRAGEMYRQG